METDTKGSFQHYCSVCRGAEGVDIDPMCVRTAGENAQRNGVQQNFKVLVGDLSNQASGQYDIICANIVANAIKALVPAEGLRLQIENLTPKNIYRSSLFSSVYDATKDDPDRYAPRHEMYRILQTEKSLDDVTAPDKLLLEFFVWRKFYYHK